MPMLALEIFGDDIYWAAQQQGLERFLSKPTNERAWYRLRPDIRPSCTELIALAPDGAFVGQPVEGRKDFDKANSAGSRGVYMWFALREGATYRVLERFSWGRWGRYYCVVRDGQVVQITEEEVRVCLSEA